MPTPKEELRKIVGNLKELMEDMHLSPEEKQKWFNSMYNAYLQGHLAVAPALKNIAALAYQKISTSEIEKLVEEASATTLDNVNREFGKIAKKYRLSFTPYQEVKFS